MKSGKRKIYKKLSAFFMAGAMIFSFAACTNPSTSTGSAGNSSGGGETVQLKMTFWDSNQEPGLKAMADDFMKSNSNIKIAVETMPWEEYWTKLQTSAQGGNMPDIIVMHPDEVKNYAEGGALMDLTDRIAKSQTVNLDNFPKYVNEDFKIDDKYYGIPKDIGTLGLCYNKDLFDQAGVAYPDSTWTWDTLKQAAQKLTNKSKGTYGIATPNDGQNFYWNLIWQNGGDLFSADGKKCTFDSPEVIEAMEYAVSFIKEGYSPSATDLANLTADEYFESGKAAMVFAGSWMLNEYMAVKNLNFNVAELPKGKQRAAICSGMAYSVAAGTKHPEEAWKFVEYLGSKQGQTVEAQSGIAIPAYSGTQQPWVDGYKKIDASPFVKVAEYGHTSPGLTTSNEESAVVDEIMPQIYALKVPVADGCKQMAQKINELIGQ